mmetsp:Transcript_522/g.821  ORF Transcript_522/g.821 Transcript_522/m.821 type:complete len:106 (+) Transcript_522:41-358(+)
MQCAMLSRQIAARPSDVCRGRSESEVEDFCEAHDWEASLVLMPHLGDAERVCNQEHSLKVQMGSSTNCFAFVRKLVDDCSQWLDTPVDASIPVAWICTDAPCPLR